MVLPVGFDDEEYQLGQEEGEALDLYLILMTRSTFSKFNKDDGGAIKPGFIETGRNTERAHQLLSGHKMQIFVIGLTGKLLMGVKAVTAKDGHHSHTLLLLTFWNQSLCTGLPHTPSNNSNMNINSKTSNHRLLQRTSTQSQNCLSHFISS
ncbi:hypothetical protein HAX54_049889 [Datura stramonium]|uniref:Uncharacterized protein n=1 Tax=Datura stramonium TaxID=4076 RepID=A0ABS8WNM6_DATST|nr:hypothetical protein [Datura stramonium]